MSASITEVVLKSEILTYTGEQFHTVPKDAKAFLQKQGIAIIPNVLDENECHQMNEGMWQTVEYLTSKLQKPLVRSDSNTYDSLSFLEDEPPGKVIIHKLRGEVSLVKQDTIDYVSVAYLKFIIDFLRKKKKTSFDAIF